MFLKRVLQPHPSLTDPEARRQSWLLGVSVTVLTALFVCVDAVLLMRVAGYQPPWFGYVTLFTTLALNRIGHYRIAGAVAVAMFPAVVFRLVYGGTELPYLSLSFLAIGPMLGAIFLPVWGVALLTFANVCGIGLAPLFVPALAERGPELLGPLAANAMVGILASLYMLHRNALEADRRRALQESQDRMRQAQKMEALGRMSGGIAHDFNNVLTVILSSVELLRRRTSAQDLDNIEAAASSAAALTRKLLAFSRGAALAPTVLDLDEVVRGATAMIGRLIREDIAIRYEPSPVRWLARIDGGQLEQVLLNLASNARDAMPDGGTLGIGVSNVTLGERDLLGHPEAKPGDYVRLRVSDTGTGMDEETRRHIFEPFFTTKERGKGTGLGLAMVFGTVSQSGGFIEVRSTPGQGTVFDLYFPRVQGAPTPVQSSHPRAAHGSETLLLVEDDSTVRRVIGLILTEAGYRVIEASSPEAARAIWAERAPEIALLITDEVMPGGHGSDLVAELRRSQPDLRALCMTGYAEPRGASALATGELPTLQKPFEGEVLLRRVRELLDSRPMMGAAAVRAVN